MAVEKFYDAVVTMDGTGGPPPTGGTALPHVRSVTITYEAEMLDITEMGNQTRRNLAGLKNWSMEVEFLQDFADNNIDELLFAKIGAVKFYIQVKPTSAVIGANNPQFYGECVLESYEPMTGSVGDAHIIAATFQCAGDLTRSVT